MVVFAAKGHCHGRVEPDFKIYDGRWMVLLDD